MKQRTGAIEIIATEEKGYAEIYDWLKSDKGMEEVRLYIKRIRCTPKKHMLLIFVSVEIADKMAATIKPKAIKSIKTVRLLVPSQLVGAKYLDEFVKGEDT